VATPEQIADEAKRAWKVRQLVDIASNLIMQSRMTRQDAEILVSHIRGQILTLFPDGAETYELVYAQKFKRLIDEFADPRQPAVIIPFRSHES
jgi:hypothetical protein